jgi:hypothetical protein
MVLETKQQLAPGGQVLEWTAYWQCRYLDGDVTADFDNLTEPAPPASSSNTETQTERARAPRKS